MNINLLNPGESRRLVFRKLKESDALPWTDFILSEKAMEFFSFPRQEYESLAWIQRQLNRYKENTGGLMAVMDKSSGKFLGQCGLLLQDLEDQKVWEVGYSFLPEFWNKGYATEAAEAFYNHGLRMNLADSIYSVIHIRNISSQRVAEKNGLYLWKTTVWKNLPVQVWRLDRMANPESEKIK